MVTLIMLFSFLGFYLFYNTSAKADLDPSALLVEWAQEQSTPATFLGGFFLALAMVLSIWYLGTGSGIFSFTVIIMTVGSLVILLAPLRVFTIWGVSLVFLLCEFLESIL